MPQDKCHCADSNISCDFAFTLSGGVVGDKNAAEKGFFEQGWKNKKTERQNNAHWIINNAYREKPGMKTDNQ